jgi:hypothetical protein
MLFLVVAVLLSTVSACKKDKTTDTDDITWELNNGVLIISGEGAIPDGYYDWTAFAGGLVSQWYKYQDSIHTVIIETGITTFGEASFSHCENLISITISNSVTSIGDYAFWMCTSLTSITNLNPVPIPINSNVFGDVNISECTLKVPMSSVSAYQNTEIWKEFNIVGIE